MLSPNLCQIVHHGFLKMGVFPTKNDGATIRPSALEAPGQVACSTLEPEWWFKSSVAIDYAWWKSNQFWETKQNKRFDPHLLDVSWACLRMVWKGRDDNHLLLRCWASLRLGWENYELLRFLRSEVFFSTPTSRITASQLKAIGTDRKDHISKVSATLLLHVFTYKALVTRVNVGTAIDISGDTLESEDLQVHLIKALVECGQQIFRRAKHHRALDCVQQVPLACAEVWLKMFSGRFWVFKSTLKWSQ